LEFPFSNLFSQVIVVESGKKIVSSSQAHSRVPTSALFEGRPERAEKRLAELIAAFRGEQWNEAFEICWNEFWDMHALFETSWPSFGYMEPGTIEVLKFFRELWAENKDGPLVTMDAGANIHALYRADQSELARAVRDQLRGHHLVLTSGSAQ
jgi:diphosphomevalonate decarboxylase